MTGHLLVIAGPTASGKTSLAVWLAQLLNGEVVSADSMQIYRGLPVGTAQPTATEMMGVPHHLIGFLPPAERFSVAQYAVMAREVIKGIHARQKLPILCGGTGLYIEAVTQNIIHTEQEPDPVFREKWRRQAAEQGGEALLKDLAAIDPETAARLHPHDITRIIRALEVFKTTGISLTEQNKKSREQPPPYDTDFFIIDFHNRQILYDRIDRRVDRMMENGLLEEAKAALALYGRETTAMQAIGYKELAGYFAGEASLDEAVAHLKQETRRYAKRQLTWFRHMKDATVLYADDYLSLEAMSDAIIKEIYKHG